MSLLGLSLAIGILIDDAIVVRENIVRHLEMGKSHAGAAKEGLLALSVGVGIGMIWYVWWLAALSFLAILGVVIVHSFNYVRDFHIPAADVAKVEDARTAALAVAAA